MNKSMKDEIKSKFHEVKGSVKEKAGKVTNNPDLKAEGHAEKLSGKVQKKVTLVQNRFLQSESRGVPSYN